MKIRTKVWINDDQNRVVFGSGRARMLEAIERLGSMNRAAKEMKMSYRAVWGRIKSTEERLGTKILATSPGGGKRCGSILTPTGKRLLEKYRLLKEKIVKQADQAFEEIFEMTSDD
jgi:molybdate transport system regulatory protein